jgi:hypothetical protein
MAVLFINQRNDKKIYANFIIAWYKYENILYHLPAQLPLLQQKQSGYFFRNAAFRLTNDAGLGIYHTVWQELQLKSFTGRYF